MVVFVNSYTSLMISISSLVKTFFNASIIRISDLSYSTFDCLSSSGKSPRKVLWLRLVPLRLDRSLLVPLRLLALRLDRSRRLCVEQGGILEVFSPKASYFFSHAAGREAMSDPTETHHTVGASHRNDVGKTKRRNPELYMSECVLSPRADAQARTSHVSDTHRQVHHRVR